MTEADIEKIMVWGLEGIADDLGMHSEYMQDSIGEEVDAIDLETLDKVLKKQFKRMQEMLNECI